MRTFFDLVGKCSHIGISVSDLADIVADVHTIARPMLVWLVG